jgi:hypothetical protein
MSGIPASFPDVLLTAVPGDLDGAQEAVIAAPELTQFWQSVGAHVLTMGAKGWKPMDAACVLVGAVLTPLAVGYDAHGTLARRVRERVDMPRRAKAAALARELADMLDAVRGEALPPDAVISVAALLHRRLIARDAPSYLMAEPTSALLRRLADALTVPPDFGAVPGLASQKPSWRGFIREVKSNFDEYGFALREADAVRLVQAVCREAGMASPPGRDAVRDALRAVKAEGEDSAVKTALKKPAPRRRRM